MNKEIEKAKENICNARKFNTSGVTPRWEDVDTIMQYMEQNESILNKVTDIVKSFKEDIKKFEEQTERKGTLGTGIVGMKLNSILKLIEGEKK